MDRFIQREIFNSTDTDHLLQIKGHIKNESLFKVINEMITTPERIKYLTSKDKIINKYDDHLKHVKELIRSNTEIKDFAVSLII